MAAINETMDIDREILDAVLRRSWILDLPEILLYIGSQTEPLRQGPGRVIQEQSTGQLWLEITAHSQGLQQRIVDMYKTKAGTTIGNDRLWRMLGREASGVEW